MSIERSEEFVLAALFLSRCGRKIDDGSPLPPAELGTDSWATSYAMFFDSLAAGRSFRSFHNSLKATRDQFDSHVDSGRRGWRVGGGPKPLPDRDSRILETWNPRSNSELWLAVRPFTDLEVANVPGAVLQDLGSHSDEDEETVAFGMEGTARALVSKRRERSPRLRAAALAIHGYECQVCGFNFERTYGSWGLGFAEIHHIQELGLVPDEGVETNPATDLAVVCSNCHRMIHRKAKLALTLAELRDILMAQVKEMA
ncbi:HNH endonuclease [Gemmatimonadota bacterium]